MAKNTSVLLGDRFESFINAQVQSGNFSSASEVIRAALRLLQQENEKTALLRKALEAGETSGMATPFDNEAFKQEMMAKYVHPDVKD
ncbi:MAG: type II toxin-antitoxin system ParD family antitoxin [Bacteroidetes bacterium]|nr:MAG: type II toxin-antitoxin system ParD family antitoxin [Bacteroidota bacterium]